MIDCDPITDTNGLIVPLLLKIIEKDPSPSIKPAIKALWIAVAIDVIVLGISGILDPLLIPSFAYRASTTEADRCDAAFIDCTMCDARQLTVRCVLFTRALTTSVKRFCVVYQVPLGMLQSEE